MSNGDPTYKELVAEVLHRLGRLEGKLDAYEMRVQSLEKDRAVAQQVQGEYIPRMHKLESDIAGLKLRFAMAVGGGAVVMFFVTFAQEQNWL